MATIIQKSRRVSFDLEHNTIYVLPTEKQIKECADRLRREAYQNRTLNQEILDDSIISEIVEACHCSSRQGNQVCLKSCLKEPTLDNGFDINNNNNNNNNRRRHNNNSNKRRQSSRRKQHHEGRRTICAH